MTSSVNKLIGTFAQVNINIDSIDDITEKCIIIDTSENRIGINTINPQYEIDVSGGGTIKTDNLIINKLIINNLPKHNDANFHTNPIGTVYSQDNYLKIKKT
tara:strand:- start:3203 stop:3508 length:306 start_codon:yes stop_codon:yes gene_type:complete